MCCSGDGSENEPRNLFEFADGVAVRVKFFLRVLSQITVNTFIVLVSYETVKLFYTLKMTVNIYLCF
jgi:hypothetical protein